MVAEVTGAVALKAGMYIFAGCCLAIGFRAGNKIVDKLAAAYYSNNPRELEKAQRELEQIEAVLHTKAQTAED